MHRVIAAAGLLIMILLAWLMSSRRRLFPWRTVIGGLILQVAFAGAILATDLGQVVFAGIGSAITILLSFVDAGCAFVIGPRYVEFPFLFGVLPTIIFFSSLMSVLYHLGIVQIVVRFLGRIMQQTLGTSGAESLSASANIFVGQTEAPLVVLPYLPKMTESELMSVMVGGFATVAGGVMAAYVKMGIDPGHLATASVISAPAALLIAKVLQPETEIPETRGTVGQHPPRTSANLVEAATVGASDGLRLALNVGAMMIAFLALIAMLDFGIEHISRWLQSAAGVQDPVGWKFSTICGTLFAPIAWLMGLEWRDCYVGGQLLGIKIVANEFVAYQQMSDWIKPESGVMLSARSQVIMTYALCGFSNFASIGIQVGGIGGLIPARRQELARLGLRAMLGGSLACCMTACIAGIVLN